MVPVLLNLPGLAGLDKRSDPADVAQLRCQRLVNLDVVPGLEIGGGYLRPRGRCLRWGERWFEPPTATPGGSGSLTGTFYYRYRWETPSGAPHVSRATTAVVRTGFAQVTLSGWPTDVGTVVSIERTAGDPVDGPWGALAASIDAATHATFDDTVAEGDPLSGLPALSAHVSPIGNRSFNQTAWCDWLRWYRDDTDGELHLRGMVRTSTPPSVPQIFEGWPEHATHPERLYQYAYPTGSDAGPASVTRLAKAFWIARAGRPLDYQSDAVYKSVTQPSTPTLSAVPTGSGSFSAVTGYTYAVFKEDVHTGVLSLPRIDDTGAFASKDYVELSFSTGAFQRARIYRTTDGGQYFQLLTVTATGATSYHDDTADGGLGTELAPKATECGIADGFSHVVAHQGQLVAGRKDDARSLLAFSSVLRPFNFPTDPLYQLQAGQDDGDEITALVSWGPYIIVFKRHSVWVVLGSPPNNYEVRRIPGSAGLGCVAHRTLVETSAGLIYLTDQGPALLSSPDAPPKLLADAISYLFSETQFGDPDTGSVVVELTAPQKDIVAERFHVHVEMHTSADFTDGTPLTYRTDGSGREHFKVGGGYFPTDGVLLNPGQSARVVLRPPSWGPAVDTTYYVRARLWDGYEWSTWATLDPFQRPAGDVSAVGGGVTLNKAALGWAHAVWYPPREEYWLWVPSGTLAWCDLCLVLPVSQLAKGLIAWRSYVLPATAACVVDGLSVTSHDRATYLLLVSPDGLLYVYPWQFDELDFDTRLGDVWSAARNPANFAAAVSSSGITIAGGALPTAGYGLQGSLIAIFAALGNVHWLWVTGNTETTIDGVWLEGRAAPGGGALDARIGGLGWILGTGWLRLSSDGTVAQLKTLALRSRGESGRTSVAVYTGDQLEAGRKQRWLRDMAIGRGAVENRRICEMRGRVARVRLLGIDRAPGWMLSEIELQVEPTGAVR